MKKTERENAIKRRLIALVGAIVIVIVIVIILLIGKPGDKGNENDKNALVNKITKKNIENIEVKQDADSEISTLINEYYSALLAADREKLSTLIYDAADDDKYVEQKIIEAYNNVSVYTVKGLKDNAYVVFAYWESKFINIETPAPGIETFYVVKDGDKYLIDTKLSDEEKAYIQAVSDKEEVKTLFDETNDKLMNAVESDTNLKALYDLLIENASDKTSEKTSTEETSSGNNESTEDTSTQE